MSFKSKGPKSQPSQSPKANPAPPKPTPEEDSKSTNQKSTQKPNQKINQNSKLQPGKNRSLKNQRPKTSSSEENKNNINPPPLDLNEDAKNIITNLTAQPIKKHSTPPTKSPLEPNKEAKNRITRPVFKPNMFQNGKNKITRINFKPNQNKGSKNIISRLIFDPNNPTPNKNKIGRPKLAFNDETKNKIIRHKLELNTKPKNRITRYKINPDNKQKSNNKIRRNSFKSNIETKSQIINNETMRPMVKFDRELKININGKPDKNQKNSPKLDGSNYSYKNLLDKEIQNTFKNYHDEIGKFANYGRNLKKDFIDWLEKTEKDPALINKVKDIQNNHEIASFIKDQVRNSELSQNKIADKLNETGLSISRKTVGNISLKEVYSYDKDAHHQRFDISLDSEIKERITNRLNEELEKYTSGIQHDSLYKIAKDFPDVSKTIIDRLAKNEISHEVYGNMWPSTSGTVSNETKKAIKNRLKEEAQKENPSSLRGISDDFPGASHTYVMELARERYPNKYKDLWPSIGKIPKEIKVEIINTIQNEAQKEHPRILKDIHKEFPEVGADTIKRLAHQAVSKEVHDKIWSNKIPENIKEKIREIVKNEVNLPNPRSLRSIKIKFGIGMESVTNIAKEVIPKETYEKIWPAPKEISPETRSEIIREIKYSKLNLNEIAEIHGVSSRSISNISQLSVFKEDIEKHRERFPYDENFEIGNYIHFNINSIIINSLNENSNEKYYSEPRIYPDGRRPDGLILENNDFIQKRLMNTKIGAYLREKLGLDLESLRRIKATQFDFTNDMCHENLINKIVKYQSQDTLLIIVGTRWYLYDEIKYLPVDDRIKYPENVRVISHNLGADLIGLKGKDKAFYERIIEHNYNHDLDSLKALYTKDLSSIKSHNTQELKKDLIQNGFIQENFNDYFSFDELIENDPKEKQLGLDHFLNC